MLDKTKGGVSRLIVFLGNPGLRFNGTRHNAGFMAADAIEQKLGVKINKAKFKALVCSCKIGSENVLLMKPQTYMNLSGEAVNEAVKFYRIPPENVLVVSDEIALDTGRIRIRPKGSAGGHNGLKNIIFHLGTDEFPRIRIGVGSPSHPDYDMKDWVLGVFRDKDAELMEEASKKVADSIVCIVEKGLDKAMNMYNR